MYTQLIKKVGEPVLSSEIFKQAGTQTHHKYTTVAAHTMAVTLKALQLSSILKKFNIDVNVEDIIIGALCHDLGIINRYNKYKNNVDCYRKHPIDSVDEAKKLYPDLNERVNNIIKSHMFPLTFTIPHSKEAIIVILSDKIVSVQDVLRLKKSYGN